jgi:hypothetical protein
MHAKIDDVPLFATVGVLTAALLVAGIGLALTIKREYLHTYVSLQTGCAYAQSYFVCNEGNDARRIEIFFHHERQWRAIRDRVRQWVLSLYAVWKGLMPAWMTDDLQARIPDDFMPAQLVHDLNAQAPGGRRPTLQDMGVLRRVSQHAAVVAAKDAPDLELGARIPAPKHLQPARTKLADDVPGGIANDADGVGDVHLDRSTEAQSSLKPDGGGSSTISTSVSLGNRHLGLRSIGSKDVSHITEELAHRYNLKYAPKIWTMRDERESAALAGVSKLPFRGTAPSSRACGHVQGQLTVSACAWQVIGPTNGERAIARVNAEGGRVLECGADGTCMFHAFIVGAIINPGLEPAVSRPSRLGRPPSPWCVLTPLLLQVCGVSAPDLRALVVREMTSDWPRYAPFIEDHLHASYLATMALSTEYAGEAELFALSKLCGVTICVWGAENNAIIAADPAAPVSLPTVNLAHRDAGNFRDHYWAVQLPERGDDAAH